MLPSSFVCRAGSGDTCDPDEFCPDVAGAACPADTVATAGTVCRADSGDGCDPAEVCSGSATVACPADIVTAGGTPCDDTLYCTESDACDGGGDCVGTARDCDDAVFCTTDYCDDGADTCVNTTTPSPCDDVNPCTTDSCDNTLGCSYTAEPLTGCYIATKTRIQVRNDDEDDTKDNVRWRWRRGQEVPESDIGLPISGTDYGICIYDEVAGVPTLVSTSGVPHNPFWVLKNGKAKYHDKDGTFQGTKKVWLRTGPALKTNANWRATGPTVDVPIPYDAFSQFAVDPVVVVQMVTSDGTCWTSSYGAGDVKKNTLESFIAVTK